MAEVFQKIIFQIEFHVVSENEIMNAAADSAADPVRTDLPERIRFASCIVQHFFTSNLPFVNLPFVRPALM